MLNTAYLMEDQKIIAYSNDRVVWEYTDRTEAIVSVSSLIAAGYHASFQREGKCWTVELKFGGTSK